MAMAMVGRFQTLRYPISFLIEGRFVDIWHGGIEVGLWH